MSEIDDLAKELGINDDAAETVIEKQPIEVTSAKQLEASNKLIEKCRGIYQVGRENDLAWRWMIGAEVDEAYANEDLYESSILKRMSEELDIAVSDLSRFRKFHVSFDKEKIIERAQVGYTWSHFKVINDLPDGDIKSRMIALVDKEDEAPKIKELQQTIDAEKNSQFESSDAGESAGLGGSTGDASGTSTSTPVKPINSSLKAIDKLLDYLTDLYIQEEAGTDFDSDAKEEKYGELMDELNDRLSQVVEMRDKIWKIKSNDVVDDDVVDEIDTE